MHCRDAQIFNVRYKQQIQETSSSYAEMHNATFDVLRTKTKLLLAEISTGVESAASRAIVVSRVHGFVSKPHYCTGGRIAGVF